MSVVWPQRTLGPCPEFGVSGVSRCSEQVFSRRLFCRAHRRSRKIQREYPLCTAVEYCPASGRDNGCGGRRGEHLLPIPRVPNVQQRMRRTVSFGFLVHAIAVQTITSVHLECLFYLHDTSRGGAGATRGALLARTGSPLWTKAISCGWRN